MRQHITPDQLAELTPEQREMLREWWKPRKKDGDWFYGTYGKRDEVDTWILSPYCVDSGVYGASLHPDEDAAPDPDALPLLSIGQCIEYLRDKDPARLCRTMQLLYRPQFVVVLSDGELIDISDCKPGEIIAVNNIEKAVLYQKPVELIDALFEAIKAVEPVSVGKVWFSEVCDPEKWTGIDEADSIPLEAVATPESPLSWEGSRLRFGPGELDFVDVPGEIITADIHRGEIIVLTPEGLYGLENFDDPQKASLRKVELGDLARKEGSRR